jgi:hypothetical protein
MWLCSARFDAILFIWFGIDVRKAICCSFSDKKFDFPYGLRVFPLPSLKGGCVFVRMFEHYKGLWPTEDRSLTLGAGLIATWLKSSLFLGDRNLSVWFYFPTSQPISVKFTVFVSFSPVRFRSGRFPGCFLHKFLCTRFVSPSYGSAVYFTAPLRYKTAGINVWVLWQPYTLYPALTSRLISNIFLYGFFWDACNTEYSTENRPLS